MTTMKPRSTGLGRMAPGERQRLLAKKRREQIARRDEALITNTRRSLLQAQAQAMSMYLATKSIQDNYRKYPPIRLGDLGPQVNIAKVMEQVKIAIQWASENDCVVTDAQWNILKNVWHQSVEKTLDEVAANFTDLDGSIPRYRLLRYGDPLAPNRHDSVVSDVTPWISQ